MRLSIDERQASKTLTAEARESTISSPNGEFEIMRERPPQGLFARFVITTDQLSGLLFGGGFAYVRQQKARGRGWYLGIVLLRIGLSFTWPFLDKQLIRQPFPVQFRRRLERLGPTYIKLGQILSLREDILPKSITDELKNLLDRLPIVPFARYKQLIEADLGRPADEAFAWIDPHPLGSASLAQTHRARLDTGEEVVLKVIKPGVREMVTNDTRLMRFTGSILQRFLARYQPQRLINEFAYYTNREVDLRLEADNAEMFTANFKDQPQIIFPRVYRHYSNKNVLCMDYFDGVKLDPASLATMSPAVKREVVDLGVSATIRMIFRDGFFHADLHPGNFVVFEDARVGFIDLGMVGRFDDDMRKRVLYYFYSLVMGDLENAARHLTSISNVNGASNVEGFRRAVYDLNRRWFNVANFSEFSIAQLILQSLNLAGKYHIQYPAEVILMVKALITIEGVGHLLYPELNVRQASRGPVRRIFFNEYNPVTIARELLPNVPELVDTLVRSPHLLSEGMRLLEQQINRPPAPRFSGLREIILAGFCLVAASVLLAFGQPWPIWAALLVIAIILIIKS